MDVQPIKLIIIRIDIIIGEVERFFMARPRLFLWEQKEKGKLANYTFGRYSVIYGYIHTWKTETRNEYFTNR
jgi:hypothetical protein